MISTQRLVGIHCLLGWPDVHDRVEGFVLRIDAETNGLGILACHERESNPVWREM